MPQRVIGHAEQSYKDGNYEEAVSIAKKWLDDENHRPAAQRILSLSLYHLGQFPEAIRYAQENVDEYPVATSYVNLGLLLSWPKIARHEEAADAYKMAFEVSPKHPKGHWGWTQQYLRTGRWLEGWDLFDKYGKGHGFEEPTSVGDRWTGTPLGDRKLLVLHDQGLGDTIQFSRFISQLRSQLGINNIQLKCNPSLAELFVNSFPSVEVLASGEENAVQDDEIAAWIPINSLPAILRTTLEALPRECPYLQVPDLFAQTWQSRIQGLAANPKVKVGIKWAGEKRVPEGDDPRSCKLVDFRPICEMEGVSIFSLQKDDPENELVQSDLQSKIINLMPQVNSMADTAAIIQQMDVVVSVDTSVAHLAGALGKTTYVLLREDPDYRWGIDASQNLWYPSTVQFRQITAGRWSDPVSEVVEKLSSFIAASALDRGP